jgi:hypothetical protein
MAATITHEFMCGVTEKIRDAMEAACEFSGMRPSQYARQAIVEKLVREGFINRPSFRKFDNSIPQISEPAE